MNAVHFVRTLYLGDRCCKSITIDGWNSSVRIQVDSISRVRDNSGHWDYYTAEDVMDGILVFQGVSALELKNSGRLPNDAINNIDVSETADGRVAVEMSIDAVEADASHHETLVRILCASVHIEDPARPGLKITA